MRIVKEADVRRNEILDTAEQLFQKKGYAKTTTGDILQEIGIARGTLYYHFKSKEEILYAAIDRRLERRAEQMEKIAEDHSLDVWQKLYRAIELQKNWGMVAEGLHDVENAQFHQRSFSQGVVYLGPVFKQIVEEGIASGIFENPYPQESVELLLCASQLFDQGIFQWKKTENDRKADAFLWLLERTLGVQPGACSLLKPLFEERNN